MTSLPRPLPGRDTSSVVFPDLAPAPSVVAAYPLGLSPETAASPDLSDSQPYGHLLSFSYPGPATPGDFYLPSQQLSAARSQLFHRPAEHPQELEAAPPQPRIEARKKTNIISGLHLGPYQPIHEQNRKWTESLSLATIKPLFLIYRLSVVVNPLPP
ncbi:hypothetical protein STEG23_018977 [Scotinomys teguina]